MRRSKKKWSVLILAAPFVIACMNPSRPERPDVVVAFSYHSPVSPGQPVVDPVNFTGCAHHYAPNGFFGLSGSWSPDTVYRNFQGDCHQTCAISIPGIPVGSEHVVRMWDLGMCSVDAVAPPVSFVNLTANGVALGRIVQHVSGMSGAAFTVDASGRVTP